jgi:DNA primase
MKTEDFDVLSYLQNRGIAYSHSGDNVSSGWVGINCLFCIDHSDHLGINLRSKAFSCFKCGETGNAIKLIQTIDGVSVREAFETMGVFGNGLYVPREKHYQEKAKLPVGSTKSFFRTHLDYLKNRNFDPDRVIKAYDLYATGPVGEYKHRIIIPVIMNGRMQSFVGRDITNQSEIPYKNSSENNSVRDPKKCLYNIDSVLKDTIVVVEGIFDAWRIGDGAVATFGIKYTHEQIRLMRGMKRAFVLFDSDAIPMAHRLAHDLSSVVPKVEVLELAEGDPDNLSTEDVKALRKDIGL